MKKSVKIIVICLIIVAIFIAIDIINNKVEQNNINNNIIDELAAQGYQQPESVSARHISRPLYTASGVSGRVLLPFQSPKNRRSNLLAPSKSRRCILRSAALSR